MITDNIQKIEEVLEGLMNDIEEYAFKEIEFVNTKENWLNSNKGAIKSKKIVVNDEKILDIFVNTDKQMYLSYNESKIKFSSPPECDLNILSNKKYSVILDAKVKGELNVTLYIIGYNNDKKVKQFIIGTNKTSEIEFDSNCNKYRVALRLIGEGELILNKVTFKPIKNDIKNKDIVQRISNYENIETKRNIKKVSDLKIACILDEFSFESFSKECELITFTPINFIDVLEANKPDMLLVESAWKGYRGSWEFKIAKYNNQDKTALYELLYYCKSKGIPTVFWNKEDPIHYDKFIDTAKLFDYVFTTDRNIIEQYKVACGHDNVFSLPFAAQVKTHNPIKKYNRKKGVCFAGSYYGNRHEDRKRDMDNVLDACMKYNLEIFDRNFKVTQENPQSPFRYPEKFENNVKGSLSYNEIDKAYKGYEVMLNVNSVKDSPTMFSRRVYEGLASGTPIISTYSKGINEMFGDIIISDDDEKLLENKIEKLMSDKVYWKELSLRGIRKIMYNHTYDNRLRYMASKLGINIEVNDIKISIISFVKNRNDIESVLNYVNNQNYDNIEVVLLVTELFDGYVDCINEFNTESVKLYIKEFVCNNYTKVSDICKGDYIAYITLNNIYGENYLLDLASAITYTDADIIGKKSYYAIEVMKNKKYKINIKGVNDEYTFVDSLLCDRSIINIKSVEEYGISEMLSRFLNNNDNRELFRHGKKLFSSDNNNFIESKSNSKVKSLEINKIMI